MHINIADSFDNLIGNVKELSNKKKLRFIGLVYMLVSRFPKHFSTPPFQFKLWLNVQNRKGFSKKYPLKILSL